MTFGEKVRNLRKEKKLSQTELGERCGLSLRTIRSYETEGRYPKKRSVYPKLAAALECSVNYLLAENEELEQPMDLLGREDLNWLLEEVTGLFYGSSLPEEEKDLLMGAFQEAYWEAKRQNKERYAPQKDGEYQR